MKILFDIQDPNWKKNREEAWKYFLSKYKSDYRSAKKRERFRSIFMGEINPFDSLDSNTPDYEIASEMVFMPQQCEENWRVWFQLLADTSVDSAQRESRAINVLVFSALDTSLEKSGWDLHRHLELFKSSINLGKGDSVLDYFGLDRFVHPEKALHTATSLIRSVLLGEIDPERVPIEWIDWYVLLINDVDPDIFLPSSTNKKNKPGYYLSSIENSDFLPNSIGQDIIKSTSASVFHALHHPRHDYAKRHSKYFAHCYASISADEFENYPPLKCWRDRMFELLSSKNIPPNLLELSNWLSVHEGNKAYLYEITVGRRDYVPADKAGAVKAREYQEFVKKHDKREQRQSNAHKSYVDGFSNTKVIELFDRVESIAKTSGIKIRGMEWLRTRSHKMSKDRLHDLVDSLRPLAKRKTMTSADSRARALQILYPEHCYAGSPLEWSDPDPMNYAFGYLWEFVASQLKAEYGKGAVKVKVLGRQNDGEPIDYQVTMKLGDLVYVQEYEHRWEEDELFKDLSSSLEKFCKKYKTKHQFHFIKTSRGFDSFSVFYLPENFSDLFRSS